MRSEFLSQPLTAHCICGTIFYRDFLVGFSEWPFPLFTHTQLLVTSAVMPSLGHHCFYSSCSSKKPSWAFFKITWDYTGSIQGKSHMFAPHQTLLSTALVNVISHCWLIFCKGESSLYSHIQPLCVGAQTHLSVIFLTLLWLETRRHLCSASIQPAERHKPSLSQTTQWLQKHLQEPHTWITEEGGRREKQNVTILCSLLDFLQRNGFSSLLKPDCSL